TVSLHTMPSSWLYTFSLHDALPISTAHCLVAADGDHALELLHNEEAIPDYIFLDLNMPKMDGFELLTAIRKSKILRDIPVIVYSDRKSTRLNSSHVKISYAVFCM